MKKGFFTVLTSIWITCVAVAQTPFEQGNAAYKNEQYEQAIAAYEQALHHEQESAELYYNLGSAHYKLGHIAPSIYYLEKALLLQPNDPDIQTNLLFAQKLQIDEVKAEKHVGIGKGLRDFAHWQSYDQWGVWSVVFAFMGFALFALYYLSRQSRYKRIGFAGLFIAFGLMSLCSFTAFWVKDQLEQENPGIVFERRVEVKSEPQSAASTVFQLHEGTKIWVVDQVEGYHKIELADGKTGWLPTTAIRLLRE